MANPAPYVVSYSFGNFQANSPTTPLPGASVDNELANIATAVAAVISALGDIRRSDGALNNGVVTFDSFEAGLQLMLDPTNGQLVAAAVATAQAAQAAASGSATAAAGSAASALTQALAAAASAATVNLTLYLAKANNLAGLGSLPTSRANLGLGTAAVLNVGAGANNIVQLDGAGKIPAYDGSQLTNVDVLPVGAVLWTPSSVALAGMLLLNGQLVSRATFARLWTFANGSGNITDEATFTASQWGSFSTGDLATTFRLPDTRGEFMRGWDNGRGVDTARLIGSSQADLFKSHTHTSNAASTTSIVVNNGAGVPVAQGGTATINATGGSETRPRNVAMNCCIKY